MIGTRPRLALAALEYRYALDAIMPMLAEQENLLIRCNVPQLMNEVTQRLPISDQVHHAEIALWVEPLRLTWRDELAAISERLSHSSLLIIVASRPLARLLPERQAWQGEPLGMQVRGLSHLCTELRQMGWVLERQDGIHSLQSIVLNQLSGLMSRLGRVAFADRLEFSARLHYRSTDLLAPWSTVALLVARKESL